MSKRRLHPDLSYMKRFILPLLLLASLSRAEDAQPKTAEEARQFLEELKLMLTFLEVSDCNMQEGSLRCDANVNLHVTVSDGSATSSTTFPVNVGNTAAMPGLRMPFKKRRVNSPAPTTAPVLPADTSPSTCLVARSCQPCPSLGTSARYSVAS